MNKQERYNQIKKIARDIESTSETTPPSNPIDLNKEDIKTLINMLNRSCPEEEK